MNTSNASDFDPVKSDQTAASSINKRRTALFIIQTCFVLGLLVVWFSSAPVRQSRHLLVLFFYCFPAEFLIASVPHEPILLYFSKFYPPLVVALVAIAGTSITEILNYSIFKFVTDTSLFQKIKFGKTIKKLIEVFKRAPFLTLLLVAFTPIPFYPFRFLVVLSKYPLWKYILAIFLARTPRFYILAALGHAFKIPNAALIVLLAILIIIPYFPFIQKFLKKAFKKNET
jgi:membrane protein YqaA with SNARE-associated domain